METSSVSIGARRPPGIVRQIRREERRRGVRSATRIRASGSKAEEYVVSDRTKRLLEGCCKIGPSETEGKPQAGGAGGGTTLEALKRVDGVWRSIRNMPEGDAAGPAPVFVTESSVRLDTNRCDYDVAVCGGTLGILVATALQARGQRVVVIERGPLRGRDQEWNISRPELESLVPLGVLTQAQCDEVITKEFNTIRCGFYDGESAAPSGDASAIEPAIVTKDILNTGVKPSLLLDAIRGNFEAKGGVVLEKTAISGISVRPDGAELDTSPLDGGDGPGAITARLVVDCMGFASPIVRQARWGQKPDGVCLVVGACARGFDESANESADLIYTTTDITAIDQSKGQYFWEAFPAGSGPEDRTTYMFTYIDAHPSRPSLADLLDDYWDLMPKYQGLDSIDDVELLRVLFGYFPTYRDSPLPARWDRITQIGDASGMQSPLSFGGLAALLRHLPRLTDAMEDALLSDLLDRGCLAAMNQYQPALSASWLFQKCMSVSPGTSPPDGFINKLMRINFGVMSSLGDEVMRPFLQDVVKFGSLGKTLVTMTTREPMFVPQILIQAGPGPIVDWFRHFIALGAYNLAAGIAESSITAPVCRALMGTAPSRELIEEARNGEAAGSEADFAWDFAVLDKRQKFMLRRKVEAWKWGSGRDYDDQHA